MLAELFSTFTPLNWIIFSSLLLFTIIWWRSRAKNLPPSPGISLPIIGHLYMLDAKNSRKQFQEWSEKIGHVFSFRMGAKDFVFINDYELIKKLTIKQADTLTGRTTVDLLGVHVPTRNNGLVFSSGPLWKEQRAVALTILRNLGMGKNILADKISEEVSVYLKELSSLNGEPSDIKTLTNMSVSNVICSVIFGQRFQFDDPQFKKIVGLFNLLLEYSTSVNIINIIPSLIYLPFDFFGAKKLLNTIHEVQRNSEFMVEKIGKKLDPENVDNFIVAYIQEMKKKQKSGQPTHLSYENLARCIDDLFIAGTETTSTTILWCLLYSIHHPDQQEKVYQEILEKVGTERTPNMMDRQNLKYLNAFIMETQRIANIAPLVLYECMADTNFETYTIPKGTQIISNLDSVLRNKKIWGDPENFRPERFIEVDGSLQTPDEFIPFSVGRRVCLGESLAKMELYLYMASLFQKFKFLPEDENNLPSLQDTVGITSPPLPYRIRVIQRLH
ncbi:cytochrome P450 2J2-like [Physella acuta]|uniref:cytochrome P450 2J2-like n=1 Tax=Physella acuta TaxID=109671 RepID=UPI0027DD9CA9|nr:cytochrome P450 2J2-like [Physella acuta]